MISFCTQTACKDTAFFRIVQVFYAICPIFLLSYRDDIGEERDYPAQTRHTAWEEGTGAHESI
jgi:hypothetical protein